MASKIFTSQFEGVRVMLSNKLKEVMMAQEKKTTSEIMQRLVACFTPSRYYSPPSDYSYNCAEQDYNGTFTGIVNGFHQLQLSDFAISSADYRILESLRREFHCLKSLDISYATQRHSIPTSDFYVQVRQSVDQLSDIFLPDLTRELRLRDLLAELDNYTTRRLQFLMEQAHRYASPTTLQVNQLVNISLTSLGDIRTQVNPVIENGLIGSTSNFTDFLFGIKAKFQALHHNVTRLPYYASPFVEHFNPMDSYNSDNRKLRARYGRQTHYRLHTEFCYVNSRLEMALELTQQLEGSQINATHAYLAFDPTHGYETFPVYSDSGWPKCYWDTAEMQFGLGAVPGVLAPPECNPSTPYNFINKRPLSPYGFRHRYVFGSDLNPPIDDVCHKSLATLEPKTPYASARTGVINGVVFAIPTFLSEVLIATRLLTRNQADTLGLSVQVALAAIDPDSWCPLLISVIVTHLMMKMKINKKVATLVGSLSGLCFTIYREGNASLNDFSCELMRFMISISICQCLMTAAKRMGSSFFSNRPNNAIEQDQEEEQAASPQYN